jgi:hypothetical protein
MARRIRQRPDARDVAGMTIRICEGSVNRKAREGLRATGLASADFSDDDV